jgi:hypothetical protein
LTTHTPSDRPPLASRAAALAALLAWIWTFIVLFTGGVYLRIAGIAISSRAPLRPALAAAVLFGLSIALARRGSRLRAWDWVRDVVEWTSPGLALAAAISVAWVAASYGARAVSGADSFGYVSEAYLWLDGSLVIPEPFSAEAPWSSPLKAIAPLGYRSGHAPGTIVPTYSPGLPLIMAAFHAAIGICGPYFVQPVFAALFVLTTLGLAWRVSHSRFIASLAALFVACSPAHVFNLMTPMSDTVAATLWTGALLAITWPGVAMASVAGVLTSIAVLVRPNLVPLAVALVLAAALWPASEAPVRRRAARVAIVTLCVTAASIFIALLNARLYGSPTMSGYGPTSSLYGVGLFPGNVARYTLWLWQSEGIFPVLALIPFVVSRARPERAARVEGARPGRAARVEGWLTWRVVIPFAVFAALLCVSYFLYVHFNDWWYLRFLLPAFPLLFILMAAAVAWFTRAAPAALALPVLVVFLAFYVQQRVEFILGLGTLTIGYGEGRYIAVADYIEKQLPENAVYLSMQHSGTLRFYSGRRTLRFDFIPPKEFSSTIDWLTANNHRPFFVLEDWEEAIYRDYLKAVPGRLANLDMGIVAELRRPVRVRVYDPLLPFVDGKQPERIVMPEDRRCAPPRDVWAR